MITALLGGLLAGLAVAMPLGPVGAYLLALSSRSARTGVAAALGVATVDGVYAGVAGLAGAALAAPVATVAPALHLGAAAVLTALAIRMLRPAEDRAVGPGRGRTYLRFVGLTAINPVTVVYFAAVVLGLHHSGPASDGWFVLGVFVASLAWQLILVGCGRGLGRLGLPAVWMSRLSAGIMIAFAVAAALS